MYVSHSLVCVVEVLFVVLQDTDKANHTYGIINFFLYRYFRFAMLLLNNRHQSTEKRSKVYHWAWVPVKVMFCMDTRRIMLPPQTSVNRTGLPAAYLPRSPSPHERFSLYLKKNCG